MLTIFVGADLKPFGFPMWHGQDNLVTEHFEMQDLQGCIGRAELLNSQQQPVDDNIDNYRRRRRLADVMLPNVFIANVSKANTVPIDRRPFGLFCVCVCVFFLLFFCFFLCYPIMLVFGIFCVNYVCPWMCLSVSL